MSRDDQLEISLRAAHDRARVAESQSLDLTKQCEQAAATLGRLIDSNTELMNKINAQSLALAGGLKVERLSASMQFACQWTHVWSAATPRKQRPAADHVGVH